MKYYIINGKIEMSVTDLRESNQVSTNYEDNYKMPVELSPAQIDWMLANPGASALEVYNMQLTPAPDPVVFTVDQQREMAYSTEMVVIWKDKMMTVDQANQLFLYYRAEGDEVRASELQMIIKSAKESIRERIV